MHEAKIILNGKKTTLQYIESVIYLGRRILALLICLSDIFMALVYLYADPRGIVSYALSQGFSEKSLAAMAIICAIICTASIFLTEHNGIPSLMLFIGVIPGVFYAYETYVGISEGSPMSPMALVMYGTLYLMFMFLILFMASLLYILNFGASEKED